MGTKIENILDTRFTEDGIPDDLDGREWMDIVFHLHSYLSRSGRHMNISGSIVWIPLTMSLSLVYPGAIEWNGEDWSHWQRLLRVNYPDLCRVQ